MSLFDPKTFEQLHQRATLRETVAGVDIDIRRTRPDAISEQRGERYYRLTQFNEHYWAMRFAYKVEDRKTIPLIAEMLRSGVLLLDMSQRFKPRCKPSAVDRELAALVGSVQHE